MLALELGLSVQPRDKEGYVCDWGEEGGREGSRLRMYLGWLAGKTMYMHTRGLCRVGYLIVPFEPREILGQRETGHKDIYAIGQDRLNMLVLNVVDIVE